MINQRIFLLFTIFLASDFTHGKTSKTNHNSVLLISFDGFRWDYQSKTDTPNLDYFEKTGVKAKSVQTVFKTATWPSHFSLATGLYPESHGIVSNNMYDPVFDEFFDMTNTDPKWYNDSEPIWVTNQKHGGKSALVLWPGFNVKIRGSYPTFAPKPQKKDNYGMPFISWSERINLTIRWLAEKNPPNLVLLYFDEPDIAGHTWGPESKELKKTIRRVDDTVGEIIGGLRKHRLIDHVNIILTSDHGQAEASDKRQIILSQYVPREFYEGNDLVLSPLIWHHMGKRDLIYKKLKNAHPHLHVYYKHEIPKGLHYRNHRRIAPLLVLPDEGWFVEPSSEEQIYHGKWRVGTHGFSSLDKSMNSFFLAMGPDFRKGMLSDTFEQVDIYPMMCKIWGLEAKPNNGTLKVVWSLRKSGPIARKKEFIDLSRLLKPCVPTLHLPW